jgi:hypothetical protein
MRVGPAPIDLQWEYLIDGCSASISTEKLLEKLDAYGNDRYCLAAISNGYFDTIRLMLMRPKER